LTIQKQKRTHLKLMEFAKDFIRQLTRGIL
jgi:hypothetical protein